MRIISRKMLRTFWQWSAHADSEQPLRAWFREACRARLEEPVRDQSRLPRRSIVGNDRVVFNIAGNKYRLIVRVNYPYRVVYIRFIGTHEQYDRINVKEV